MKIIKSAIKPNDASLFQLIDACCEVADNPAYQPRDGMTFCNQAVQFICERMGYNKFKAMMANQMVALMKRSKEWVRISIEEAQNFANQGRLVVAGWQEEPHGHVVAIRPGLPGYSGKWRTTVPKVINVGSKNFIGKSLNWSFKEKPVVYVLRSRTKGIS